MSLISENVKDVLLRPAAQASNHRPEQGSLDESEVDSDGALHSTGILPSQELKHQVNVTKEIFALEPILDNQYQPASLDLRLGPVAYRVRASFLPGKNATVKQKLEEFAMHEMDITKGGVLERGCVYIIPLLEGLNLKHRMSAMGNPKSSTGRLDIFTRLITDNGTEFDQVREQYEGMLYAEVSPRTFSVLVRKGSRLSQIRIRRGNPTSSDEGMRRLQKEFQVVSSTLSEDDIRNGVPVSVDVRGDKSGGLVGYKARNHAGLIDIDKVQHYEVLDYWEPVYAPRRGGLVLDPQDFYILASREAVKVPPTHAAEMIAYDTLVGEFRVHYAGFFDPGFGDPVAGGEGSRAVLEVRSYEVPFVIEDGQVVGRLAYERLTAIPNQLYGATNSSYQGQGIKLSKHFKPLPPPESR
ncbi:MAG: 2'-deoxycytidine 5'-triphosphate deaminase [Burkholderiales bacterium]|nr:2'-deoxycytidine 5'-triphosphate deaminase [Burkholderiales bacterium]